MGVQLGKQLNASVLQYDEALGGACGIGGDFHPDLIGGDFDVHQFLELL